MQFFSIYTNMVFVTANKMWKFLEQKSLFLAKYDEYDTLLNIHRR